MASKVRRIRCSLAWTSTCTVTSSGIRSRSIKARRISYSVSEEAGKPTSISLNPISQSIWKNSSFCSKFMGLTKAWFPSRRSTLHQAGAFVSRFPGQVLSGRSMGRKGLYFRYPCLMAILLFHMQNAPGPTSVAPGAKYSFAVPPVFSGETPPSPALCSKTKGPADNGRLPPCPTSFRPGTRG